MHYIEDRLSRLSKFGLYLLLTVVSGSMSFLGYRVGGKVQLGSEVDILRYAHADAPITNDSNDDVNDYVYSGPDGNGDSAASGNGSDFAGGDFDGYY